MDERVEGAVSSHQSPLHLPVSRGSQHAALPWKRAESHQPKTFLSVSLSPIGMLVIMTSAYYPNNGSSC